LTLKPTKTYDDVRHLPDLSYEPSRPCLHGPRHTARSPRHQHRHHQGRDQGNLIVQAPLRPTHGLHPVLTIELQSKGFDGNLAGPWCRTRIDPGNSFDVRAFRLSRNNLIGYLGLQNVALFQRDQPGTIPIDDIQPWLDDQVLEQVQDNFMWFEDYSGPLYPIPTTPNEDLLRLRVLSSFAHQDYFIFQYEPYPPPQREPGYPTQDAARKAAIKDAVRHHHFPVYFPVGMNRIRVLLWKSLWVKAGYVHQCLLSNGQFVELSQTALDGEDADDTHLITVGFREHNGAQHQGTQSFDSNDQALANLFDLIRPILNTH